MFAKLKDIYLNNNNIKKGFTLIELLAVIVILAVLMVIAVPKILDVIENSRKSAVKSSAKLYIDAIEKNNTISEVNNEYIKIEDNTYNDVTELDVKVKGKKPTSGVVTIEKGKVTYANLCINNYTVNYNGKVLDVKGKCNEDIVTIDASEVSFTPSDSNWKVSTLEEALDDLYNKYK